MEFQLNYSIHQLDEDLIQLTKNGMQIGAKGIKNLVVNMVLEKKDLKKNIDPKTHNSMPLYLGMG
jgi:hypothetical protein